MDTNEHEFCRASVSDAWGRVAEPLRFQPAHRSLGEAQVISAAVTLSLPLGELCAFSSRPAGSKGKLFVYSKGRIPYLQLQLPLGKDVHSRQKLGELP